jgi:hypothetical protein
LKFDSAINCAASSAAETFQRPAASINGARNRDGTKLGSPPAAARDPSAAGATEFPSREQGAGGRA